MLVIKLHQPSILVAIANEQKKKRKKLQDCKFANFAAIVLYCTIFANFLLLLYVVSFCPYLKITWAPNCYLSFSRDSCCRFWRKDFFFLITRDRGKRVILVGLIAKYLVWCNQADPFFSIYNKNLYKTFYASWMSSFNLLACDFFFWEFD